MGEITEKCPFCHKQFTSKDNVPIQVNYGTEEDKIGWLLVCDECRFKVEFAHEVNYKYINELINRWRKMLSEERLTELKESRKGTFMDGVEYSINKVITDMQQLMYPTVNSPQQENFNDLPF